MTDMQNDLDVMIEELKMLLQCEIEKVPSDVIYESYKARSISNYASAIRALEEAKKVEVAESKKS